MRLPNFYLLLLFSLLTTTLPAATYYWVGGSGNWSDISHWATTSGGTLTHPQAPTADDDVIFDFNSFAAAGQTVTLNTDIIFCRNMRWLGVTNNPTLSGGTNVRLNVFGSLELDPNMDFAFTGQVTFTGGLTDNTVNFGTHRAGQDVIFDGTGSWSLSNGITVDSALVLNEGSLITNSQNIDCKYFDSRTTNTRQLELGFSVLTIRGTTIDPFDGNLPDRIIQPLRLHATNLTFDAGGSIIIFTDPVVDIWYEGPGTLAFNRVILASMMGNSRILPWHPTGDSSTFPTVSFNELNLFHRTLLNGSMTINNLLLHAGQRYTFEAGQTFTFDYIEAFGDCRQAIALEATDEADPAQFRTDGNIVVSFVNLRGIAAGGSGSFMANNATDLGSNTNWTINPRPSQNFFWIGGTGNWDDPAHWSFSSGGPSSGCLPSALDDVFFDTNSFSATGQTVTINVENAYCRSMDWTGATNMPSLVGPIEHTLRLGGSLTFIPNMQNDFAGAWFFASDQSGNTITSASQPFNFDLTFAGTNGEWTLLDSIYVDWNIYFNSGTLRTNDQSVDCNRFLSDLPTQRTLVLGNSHIYPTGRELRSAIWDVQADNLVLEAGTSTIELRGDYSNLFRTEGSGNIQYHKVDFNCLEGRLFSLLSAPEVQMDSLFFRREGFISGNNTVDYWYLSPGYRYDFVSDITQTIGTLDANGNCAAGFIYIQTSNLGYTTNFQIDTDQNFERLYLHGIQQLGSGQLTANNSLDGGENINWSFNTGSGRTLYWVGDTGEWSEEAHWSLSSGGPGGECIPTPIDDVIFDTNSFTSVNASVTDDARRGAFCRNLSWEAGITENPRFLPQEVNIYGSLLIASNLSWEVAIAYFSGNAQHTITTNEVALRGLYINGSGTYTLQDPLTGLVVSHIRGTFNTNDQPVNLESFVANSTENPKRLILGSTYMMLSGANNGPQVPTFSIFSAGMTVEPGTSTIEFTHPDAGMRVDYTLDFHNIFFSEPTGHALLRCQGPNYNRIDLYGDGTVDGFLTTDSLFCTPGKTYTLTAGETVFINDYWQIIGNNCTPIELRSDMLNSRALVNMPTEASIIADFIQMRDIEATGGADFRAGARSTNIDNSNTGWLFEAAPGFSDTGLLGPDLALCGGDPVTLDAYSFSANESYLWQDGSTAATLATDQTGTYTVIVTFESNCIIRDTIEVISAQDFSVDLPDTPSLCEGESLTLDAEVGLSGASYTWQDGSSESSFEVNTAGTYFVEVAVGGCLESDSTTVSVTVYPEVDLGEDRTACLGESYTLSTSTIAENLLWQDGSTANSFTINSTGTYWLEAANGECRVRDSVTYTFINLEPFDLGADTTICGDFQGFILRGPSVEGVSYRWQDGSTADTYQPLSAGAYTLEISIASCSQNDTINVDFQGYISAGFPDEFFPCAGDTLSVAAVNIPDAYLWSDGETDSDMRVSEAGTYYLDATYGACVFRKYFEVIPTELPRISPLGADQIVCEGESVELVASTDFGSIEWQDGSTTDRFTASSSGTYWYIADNMGCIASDTIQLSFVASPELELESAYTLCAGELLHLVANQNADSYQWSTGAQTSEITITEPGTYQLEADFGSCVSAMEIVISGSGNNTLDLGQDTTICTKQTLHLQPNTYMGQMSWPDGSTSDTYTVDSPGLIIATLTLDGCTSTDSLLVSFQECPEFQVYLPNAFSPNGDNTNDLFRPYFSPGVEILSYELEVYNRWGGQVFRSQMLAEAWDGWYNGNQTSEGVYVYFLRIHYRDAWGTNQEVISGEVMLVR